LVVQRARERSLERPLERPEGTTSPRFRIRDRIRDRVRDRDSKFTRVFDDVFDDVFDAVVAADGIQVITTPVQAPNANALAERWVPTVRQECLDWLLVLSTCSTSTCGTTTTSGRIEAPRFGPPASALQRYRGSGWA